MKDSFALWSFFFAIWGLCASGIFADLCSFDDGSCRYKTEAQMDGDFNLKKTHVFPSFAHTMDSIIGEQLCNFEDNNICGFETKSLDGITWKRVQGGKTEVGPKKDKTYNNERGHYMLVVPSIYARVPVNNQALLAITPLMESTKLMTICCRFWYQMDGDDIVSFDIRERAPGGNLSKYSLWSHDIKNSRWAIGQLEINTPYNYEIVFQAVINRGTNGYIALDEILVVDGKCPPPGSCDFERDMCTWHNAENGTNLDWIRSSETAPTNNTGPAFDHTLQTFYGSYIYLQAKNPTKQRNLVGILESEYFSTFTTHCLTFFTHMYGEEMGTLSVNIIYFQRDKGKTVSKLLWKIEGNQGNRWIKRSLTVIATDFYKKYQILLVGNTKGNFNVIALDDIQVSNKECFERSNAIFDCENGRYILQKNVCDFEKDCEGGQDEANCGNCDFEHSDCHWTDVKTSFYSTKWNRRQGIENQKLVGPGYDHTFTSPIGHFMISETLNYRLQTSTLQSPGNDYQFKKSYATCIMNFYYYMADKSFATLTVRKRLGNFTTGSLWERYGSEHKGWKLGTAFLGTTKRPFYIEIIHLSPYRLTYTAIDDITFANCSMPKMREKCNSTEFTCLNKRCIPQEFLCDLTDDCGDESDETKFTCSAYPPPCTFENGECGWISRSKRNNWIIKSSTSYRAKSNTGPIVDHTKRLDSEGKYLILQKLNKTDKYNISYYFSPNFYSPVYSVCDLRFYYYMHGTNNTKFTIYAEYENSGWSWEELWSQQGDFNQAWNRGFVRVRGNKPFHFIIEGDFKTDTASVLAIDDLSLSYGCKNYSGNLPTPAPTIIPTADLCGIQFRCENNACIPMNEVCDFKDDCLHGTDEKQCPSFCNFEDGSICGWKAITTAGDNVEIKVITAETGYNYNPLIPRIDKSGKSSGKYLLVNEDIEREFGPIDHFKSPSFSTAASTCKLQFWYAASMYKKPLVILNYSKNSSVEMYQLSETNSKWMEVNMGLGRRTSTFMITFNKQEAIRKWNYFALDEIKFIDCALPLPKRDICNGFACKINKACIDENKVCDLIDDCGDGTDEENCESKRYILSDFETDYGFFHTLSNESFAPLNWKRQSGSTPGHAIKNLGPPFDHTHSTELGYYLMFTRGKEGTFGTKAWLASEVLEAKETCTMRFFYFMYGSQINELSIFSRTEIGGKMKLMWSQEGEVGNFWERQEITFKEPNPFEVIIEGQGGVGMNDVIAIDDISFTPGCRYIKGATLPPRTKITTPLPDPCPANEFYFENDNLCISKKKVCDFRNDCSDGLDERNCGN